MEKKPVSKEWARRSIRGASLSELRRIVHRKTFRTPYVFDLLAERCWELCVESPAHSLEAAGLLWQLSAHFETDAKGVALDILGSAYRRNRRYAEARKAYRQALAMDLSETVRGGILQRLAVLNLFELNYDGALEAVNCAIELLEQEDLGRALVLRSKVFAVMGELRRSSEDAGLGLTLLDCKKDQDWLISAFQSIANALLVEPGSTEDMRSAFLLIKKAKRQMRGSGSGRYRSNGWLYLDWIEGQINGRLGSHRQAVRQLEKVRDRFYEIGGDCYVRDALLVSVDLAVIHDFTADFDLAAAECETALEIAQSFGFTTEAGILRAYLSRRSFLGLDREIRGVGADAPDPGADFSPRT